MLWIIKLSDQNLYLLIHLLHHSLLWKLKGPIDFFRAVFILKPNFSQKHSFLAICHRERGCKWAKVLVPCKRRRMLAALIYICLCEHDMQSIWFAMWSLWHQPCYVIYKWWGSHGKEPVKNYTKETAERGNGHEKAPLVSHGCASFALKMSGWEYLAEAS